ncbi:hypothetical protein [Streptomyces sp. NPDC058757]|uniref:hypothetical protein n=1 Tax=Streptomyces sp. NPDC058757 TaxID=3346626 RepID=UPI003687686A
MAAEITLPVFFRVGGGPEAHVGDITMAAPGGVLELPTRRAELAAAFREAVTALETPPDADEEVPDAAA